MDLDSGLRAWRKTSRSRSSTCDPVGSFSVLGLECDVGLAAPAKDDGGLAEKSACKWLNKQWKQQQEVKTKRQHGRDTAFLNSTTSSQRL